MNRFVHILENGEFDSLVERASRLIKKTKKDYDATELIRHMRNDEFLHNVCQKHKIKSYYLPEIKD